MATITTATATLGFQVTLGSLSRTTDIDLTLNVYRRHESILYKSKSVSSAANAAFFSSKPLISTEALHVADKSASLIANHVEILDEPVNIENLEEYTVPTDKFIVTDIYTATDNSNKSAPLFYKHVLSTDNLPRTSYTDLTLQTNYKLTSVEILDIDLNSVQIDNMKVDWDEGIVYNNLVSSFDQTTSIAEVYYVRYSIKNTSNVITSYIELVNNQNIFKVAELDDLDDSLEIIDDGRKVYLIEELDNSLRVKLPSQGNYSFQVLEDARIKIIAPPQSDVSDPWNVSVTNGKFFTDIDNITYKYYISEFFNQEWDPFVPYKRVEDEDSEFISKNLVKVRKGNVFFDTVASGYIDLLVYDSDEEGVAAFTTDPSKEDDIADNSKAYQIWSPTDKLGIRSVDAKTGILDIDGLDLRSDYKLVSSYNYEETNYELSQIDFNPVNNPDILTKFVSVFVDPESNSVLKTKTLYYTIVDKAGKILKSNLSNFDNTDEKIKTSDDIWRTAYYEELPSGVSVPGAIIFLEQFSVIGSGVFLPLGEVYVSEYDHPDSSTLIDVRVRGGGIKEEEIENSKEVQQEVEWYSDISFWDGIPFPGTASYYIEVPADLLEVAGGIFKTNEVRSIIDKHTAAGVYTIAKAYGIDPVISGVIPASGEVTISWGSYE